MVIGSVVKNIQCQLYVFISSLLIVGEYVGVSSVIIMIIDDMLVCLCGLNCCQVNV